MTEGYKLIRNYQTTDPGSSENTGQDKYQNTTPVHIMMKLQKHKYLKILRKKPEGVGRKHFSYRGAKVTITSDFSETTQARRECNDTYKGLREKTHQHRILYLENPSEVKEK